MDYNRLVVWDTADGYLVDEELRAKVYQEAHVFVLFFDLHDRRSYDQITAKVRILLDDLMRKRVLHTITRHTQRTHAREKHHLVV
jgi:GTPase SAR1 family protein